MVTKETFGYFGDHKTSTMKDRLRISNKDLVYPTNSDLLYTINLRRTTLRAACAGIERVLGKELWLTRLFTQITYHSCVNEPDNQPEESYSSHYLIICRTKNTSTDSRIIDEFLEKVTPLINKYQTTCKDTEITAKLFANGDIQR